MKDWVSASGMSLKIDMLVWLCCDVLCAETVGVRGLWFW
jgi:hypothetical protein